MGTRAVTRELVYLDTNVIISVVEGTQGLSEPQRAFLLGLDDGSSKALTSELTLAECLVKPLADRNANAVQTFSLLLDNRPTLQVTPITRDVLLKAARLRAEAGMKLADAIHMATASLAGCSAFVTDDRRIRATDGIRLESWSSFRGHG